MMNIGIVGAGIAGLGAAIALRRAGHDVEIYEKSSFKNEIGAAILITPNANRILRYWGFDFEKARPVDFKQYRFIHSDTLKVALRHDFSEVEKQFGDRMCAYHRVDLHAGLKELAENARVKVHLGCEVEAIDEEKGEVKLKNGDHISKDFWILADGCHCPFLPQIAQEDIPTVKIGKSVARWLAPFDKVMENPDCAKLWEGQEPGFCTFFNERGLMLVTYPCREGKLLNCAVFHNTHPEDREKTGWNEDTTQEKVLAELEGCSDAVRYLPLTAEQLKVYTVTQRPPSSKIYKGRMLCIGDTTHHMLPSHAQGACAALEDAAALEVFFSTNYYSHSAHNLEKRLKLYQALRLPRSATTQILSSTNPKLTMAGLAEKEREMRQFYQGELVDWPMGCTSWSAPIREFFYNYNIFSEAEKAVKANIEGKTLEEAGVRWFGGMARDEQGLAANMIGRA